VRGPQGTRQKSSRNFGIRLPRTTLFLIIKTKEVNMISIKVSKPSFRKDGEVKISFNNEVIQKIAICKGNNGYVYFELYRGEIEATDRANSSGSKEKIVIEIEK
jgi:hypothetical protein